MNIISENEEENRIIFQCMFAIPSVLDSKVYKFESALRQHGVEFGNHSSLSWTGMAGDLVIVAHRDDGQEIKDNERGRYHGYIFDFRIEEDSRGAFELRHVFDVKTDSVLCAFSWTNEDMWTEERVPDGQDWMIAVVNWKDFEVKLGICDKNNLNWFRDRSFSKLGWLDIPTSDIQCGRLQIDMKDELVILTTRDLESRIPFHVFWTTDEPLIHTVNPSDDPMKDYQSVLSCLRAIAPTDPSQINDSLHTAGWCRGCLERHCPSPVSQ
jgi:hypothetical protein